MMQHSNGTEMLQSDLLGEAKQNTHTHNNTEKMQFMTPEGGWRVLSVGMGRPAMPSIITDAKTCSQIDYYW